MNYPRIALAMLVPFCLVATSCKKETEKKELIRPVKAMQVGSASNLSTSIFVGKAKASQEVNIAFEIPGRITELNINVGDKVEKGQILARIDPRNYQNALMLARAELDRSTAQRDRVKKAFESKAVSAQDMTNAESQVRAARATVLIAEKQVEDTDIKAPFSGQIAAKYVDNFENILGKQKVLRMIDLSLIEMEVDLPESLIPNVPYIDKIDVRFSPFPNTTIEAKVKEVGAEANQTTRTYPVTLLMKQPENVTILPGMAGEAVAIGTLPAGTHKTGITILPSALVTDADGKKSYVWVIDPKTGEVNRTEVVANSFSQYGMIVSEGLTAGQWIATAGVNSLQEKQKVTILKDEK